MIRVYIDNGQKYRC